MYECGAMMSDTRDTCSITPDAAAAGIFALVVLVAFFAAAVAALWPR